MKFPTFFGISDLAKLTWQKYNQDLLDIRNWWNDHNSGVRAWDVVNTNSLVMGANSTPGLYVGFQPSVLGTTTVQTHVTSSSYQATTLSADIALTNSAHRVLIQFSGNLEMDTAAVPALLTIKRDTTDLDGTGAGFAAIYSQTSVPITTGVSFLTIDQPADTSTHTYKIFLRNGSSFFPSGGTAFLLLTEIV